MAARRLRKRSPGRKKFAALQAMLEAGDYVVLSAWEDGIVATVFGKGSSERKAVRLALESWYKADEEGNSDPRVKDVSGSTILNALDLLSEEIRPAAALPGAPAADDSATSG